MEECIVANKPLTCDQIVELIPQQRPFRFVDKILEVDENHIVGEYTFRKDEMFYKGHFPDHPITPGVILLECMCQVGVVALGLYLMSQEGSGDENGKYLTLFTDAESEFSKAVYPGDKVTIRA
ncbi:beta-hydroxyacyl-ACP dehydratase, partial [bacterium]|nr:beta-hydroxyacyl-ACP dehydratase [bacterium]MBU1916529.1 beta-hydroxyacyl-ACP dehydratase [bacterium]